MEITQKQLAAHLGISRQVVGRALTGNGYVTQDMRDRILAAAKEFGYTEQSNFAARSLIAQRYGNKTKKDAIAVLMPPHGGEPTRKVPYFIPILDGIEMEADLRNIDLSLHRIRYGYMPRCINDFMVDGVIGLITTSERNEWMNQHGLPSVLIDSEGAGSSTIMADDQQGIGLCTQHLIDRGHRNIGFFAQKMRGEGPGETRRFDIFANTMRANGLAVRSDLAWFETVSLGRESAKSAMAQILARRLDFTAVVCHNDPLAMGVIDALTEAGLSVPGDVSVTGFDDVSSSYGFAPLITSVRFDREEVGRQSVRELYDMVDAASGDPLKPVTPRKVILPVSLVVRDSTGPASGNQAARGS